PLTRFFLSSTGAMLVTWWTTTIPTSIRSITTDAIATTTLILTIHITSILIVAMSVTSMRTHTFPASMISITTATGAISTATAMHGRRASITAGCRIKRVTGTRITRMVQHGFRASRGATRLITTDAGPLSVIAGTGCRTV